MAATSAIKTAAPGILVRCGVKGKTVRFSVMVKGQRFQEPFEIPCMPGADRAKAEALYLDPKTCKATKLLKDEYNRWVISKSDDVGETYGCGLREPTLGELIAYYEKIATERGRNPNFGKPSARTIASAISNIRLCMMEAGVSDDDEYSDLFNTKMAARLFDSFSSRFTGVTAWTYVNSMHSLTAHWTLAKYEAKGWKIEKPHMPDVGKAKLPPRWHRPSPEMIDRMYKFYMTIAETNKEWHKIMLFVGQFAVRPMNVFALTGKNIVKDAEDGLWHLKYVPVKTANSSGAEVNYPIHPIYWSQLEPMIGDRIGTDELLVEGSKWTLNKINTAGRIICGMEESTKFLYEYRKLCIDETVRQKGYDVAVALTGDRRDTLEYYYSEPGRVIDANPAVVAPVVERSGTETAAGLVGREE